MNKPSIKSLSIWQECLQWITYISGIVVAGYQLYLYWTPIGQWLSNNFVHWFVAAAAVFVGNGIWQLVAAIISYIPFRSYTKEIQAYRQARTESPSQPEGSFVLPTPAVAYLAGS